MGKHNRPRPSSIEQLPEECEHAVAWAARELTKRGSTLSEVYAEFCRQLIAIQGELGLDFEIPHISSFSRHSARLSKLRSRVERANRLASAMVAETDEKTEDNLTRATTLTLKTLLLELAEMADEGGATPKEAQAMATAVRQLQAAENLSTARRQMIKKEFDSRVEKIIDTVAKEKGMSPERIAQLRREFLGQRAKPKAQQ